MKTIQFLLIAAIVSILLPSCDKVNGKGEPVVQERTITGYTGISLAMDATVYFSEGDEYTMVIHAQDNLLSNIITEVEGSKLVIKVKKGVVLGTHDPITVTITAPSVDYLDISGSGNINVGENWVDETLETNISGSGNINMVNIESGNFKANISGSGSILASGGATDYSNLVISGSGNIDVRMVFSDTTYATISGSGNIYTQVSKLLDATISGSGNIYYLGNPQMNLHISGSGTVTHL